MLQELSSDISMVTESIFGLATAPFSVFTFSITVSLKEVDVSAVFPPWLKFLNPFSLMTVLSCGKAEDEMVNTPSFNVTPVGSEPFIKKEFARQIW